MFFYILLKQIFFKFWVAFKEVIYLSRLQIDNPLCNFYSGSKIFNTSFGKYIVVFNDVLMDSCIVGDRTYIQKRTSIFNAEIGKFCSIASDVSIGPGIHKMDGISTNPIFYLKNTPLLKTYCYDDLFASSKRTVIGHDVWIGEKAIILDGLNIGTGAIIAAGAVVTKDVEPYSVVGGVPAKLIRFRFTEIEIKEILKSKWWDFPESWFEKNFMIFNNYNDFINNIILNG